MLLVSTTASAANFLTIDEDGSLPSLVIILLISIAFLAFVYELFSRGIGIPSLISLVTITAFFYYQIANGLAAADVMIFLFIGIALIIVEYFIPGGIIGSFAFVALVISFIMAIGDLQLAIIAISIALLLSVALFIVMSKVFQKKVLFYSVFVLKDATSTDEGYVSTESRVDLLGKTGRCLTGLRPAGTVEIDGERIDAISEGDFIIPGVEVEVVLVEGIRVVVRAVNHQTH